MSAESISIRRGEDREMTEREGEGDPRDVGTILICSGVTVYAQGQQTYQHDNSAGNVQVAVRDPTPAPPDLDAAPLVEHDVVDGRIVWRCTACARDVEVDAVDDPPSACPWGCSDA